MNSSGKTPLFRARKLEAYLGVKKIYLKLEGANPYNHVYDRVSEYLVKDAAFRNKAGILAEGPLPYIQSIINFGNDQGLPVTVPVQKSERLKHRLKGQYDVLTVSPENATDLRHFIEAYCIKNKFFNGYNGHANINTSILAFEEIGDELYEKFGDSIDNIFIQLSYGLTLTGIHNSFERRFIKGISQQTPALVSCTIPNGNVIYDQYRKTFEVAEAEVAEAEVASAVSGKYSRYLQVTNTELLQPALDAVYDTRGTILPITDESLIACAKLLRSKEGVHVSTHEAYSFAGLYQMAKKGKLKEGTHVVILNDGKSNLNIRHVKKGQYTIDQLYQFVNSFLKQYTDSYEEVTNAISNALSRGTILLAMRKETVQGIAVVVHMGFESFIPTYHLGYIGTKEGNEGRGIATELLEEVINFTKGNVSLHVDLDNKRAMGVYAKVGFKHSYNRMLYKQD